MEGEGICRTCLKTTDKLMPLFQTPLLVFKLVAIAPVQILNNDNLPQTICEECCKNIDGFFNFKEMIINNDAILKRRYVEHAAEVVLNEKTDDAAIDLDLLEPVRIKSEVVEQSTKEENTTNEMESVGTTDYVDVLPRREENLIPTAEATDNSMTMCNACGELIHRISLERHEKFECNNPVSCVKCGQVVKNNHFLKTHIRLLHEKISYDCQGCNRVFARYKDFQRHTPKCHPKKNHNKSKRNAQQNGNHRNQKTTSATSAPINCTCNVCGMFCNSKRQLHKHMRLQHGEGTNNFAHTSRRHYRNKNP